MVKKLSNMTGYGTTGVYASTRIRVLHTFWASTGIQKETQAYASVPIFMYNIGVGSARDDNLHPGNRKTVA